MFWLGLGVGVVVTVLVGAGLLYWFVKAIEDAA